MNRMCSKCTQRTWLCAQNVHNGLKKLMFERDNLKKKATVSKTSRSWELYQKARNKTNNKIWEAKRNYYITNINTSKGNSKATWKIINSMLGKILKKYYN
jgi:hypothetical protein